MVVSMVPVAEGVRLCVQTYGGPAYPTVLLLAGATSSMDWWPPELCERLAAAGRHVVRFDQRDTGASTQWPAGEPGYTAEDLTLDPLRVLDGLGVDAAHLVGVSMGGGIAQDLAARFPGRVHSLVLVATSCALSRVDDAVLPPPSPEVLAEIGRPGGGVDWSDEDAVVEEWVRVQRVFAGPLGLDEPAVRAIVRTVARRTPDAEASVVNHWVALGKDTGDAARRAMADVHAPTLVLHGTGDPFFPVAHGEALASEIADARLVCVEGMGHEVPPRSTWDVVVPAILEHTGGSDRPPA